MYSTHRTGQALSIRPELVVERGVHEVPYLLDEHRGGIQLVAISAAGVKVGSRECFSPEEYERGWDELLALLERVDPVQTLSLVKLA